MSSKPSTNLDTSATANYLLRAKGLGRTMQAFADETGINKSTLSRIANSKLSRPLTIDLIAKIYQCRADKDDNSLLVDLCVANGYLSPHDAAELSLVYADSFESTKLTNAIKGIMANHLIEAQYTIEKEIRFTSSNSLVRKKFMQSTLTPYVMQILTSNGNTRYLRVVPCQRTKKDHLHSLLDILYPFFIEDGCDPKDLANHETLFVFTAKEDFQSFLADGGNYRWRHPVSAVLIDLHCFSVVDRIDLPKIDDISSI